MFAKRVSFSVIHELGNCLQGSTRTSRYWDCCKPSCGWEDNVITDSSPVKSCSSGGKLVLTQNTHSGCGEGNAFICNRYQPWVINDYLAYGFTSASFTGIKDTTDSNKCCACFRLDFEGSLAGKVMVVQVINTGSDLGYNEFNLVIPGGGVGYHVHGCSNQWGLPQKNWGDQYGGLNSVENCSQIPPALRKGCEFRFTFMEGISNPAASFTEVKCPSELVALSGCAIEPEYSYHDKILIKK